MAVAPNEPAAPPAPPAAPPVAPAAAPPAPPAPGLGNLPPVQPPADPNAPPAPAPKVRPEWLGEKFWDTTKGEPKVEELAKAEAAWRAQISRADHKPPEKPDGYKLDFASHTNPDIKKAAAAFIQPMEDGKPDPVLARVQARAHKDGVSQAGLYGIMEEFFAANAELGLIPEPLDAQAELGKLGQNGPALVKSLQDYREMKLKTGQWDDAQAEMFSQWMCDSEGAKFVYNFLFESGQVPEIKTAFINHQAATPDAAALDQELAEISAKKAKGEITDAQAQQMFEANLAKREKVFGKEPARSFGGAAA